MSPADAITRYSTAQSPQLKAVCKALQAEIGVALPKATSKIWYAMPVWFVGESPVVGFEASAEHVTLLFWRTGARRFCPDSSRQIQCGADRVSGRLGDRPESPAQMAEEGGHEDLGH